MTRPRPICLTGRVKQPGEVLSMRFDAQNIGTID